MRSFLLTILAFVGLFVAAVSSSAAPTLPEAKKVTLSGEMTISAALKSLADQTGITVLDRRDDADAKINLKCDKVTFWQALDDIAAAAGAQVDLYTRDGKLALKKRIGKAPPKGVQTVSYDGHFRTSVKRITASIDPETGQTSYLAALEVAWEPTLQPFYLETRPQNLAINVEGKAIPAENFGSIQAPVDGRSALLFETPISALPRAAQKIGGMEGKLSIVAPSRMLTFAFTDTLDELANKKGVPPKMTLSGVDCILSQVTVTKDRCTVRVTLTYPPGNTKLDSNQSWVVNNELTLISKDGKKRYPATSYVLENATASRAVVSYNFQDDAKVNRVRGDAKDWKLSYRTPEAVVTIPISFTFKNVPLP